jgi:hypothetical protein
MINFKSEKKILDNIGIIEMKGVGPIANAIRRVLLDEIETIRFDPENIIFTRTDPFLTHQTIINLVLIHIYEEGEFYLDVTNNSSEAIAVLSNHIKKVGTHTTIKAEKDAFICMLQPGKNVKITGIKTKRGIGRKHAKFSRVYGQVEYIPTDVHHVYFLNDRGFVEDSRRCIKRTKDIDINKRYIIWSKIGEKNLAPETAELFKDFIKLPAGDWDFRRAELNTSEDFIVKFYADDPAAVFRECIELLLRELDNEELTLTCGEMVRNFVYREKECAIFADWEIINGHYCRLTIDDPAAEKLQKTAIENIKKILRASLSTR